MRERQKVRANVTVTSHLVDCVDWMVKHDPNCPHANRSAFFDAAIRFYLESKTESIVVEDVKGRRVLKCFPGPDESLPVFRVYSEDESDSAYQGYARPY